MDIDHPPLAGALSRLDAGCPPGGRGWSAAVASILEATAPKPGNVHPAASFADLSYADLVAAGLAIAPAIERAADEPVGRTVLAAVRAARGVTRSNANLGIVLLVAPLAAGPSCRDVDAVLGRLTPQDARDVWQAIAVARPGGLGASSRFDVHDAAPTDLRAAMRHAAGHDQIARLWADGFGGLFAGVVRDLELELAAGSGILEAIVRAQLRHLAREPDTLLARRHGADVAADVSRRAADVLAAGPRWREAAAAFDAFLRSPRRLNPGTTADLIAAGLYILLHEGRLRLTGDAFTLVPLPAAATHSP